ncbi:hypothetical protein CONLIGDRAFT_566384 [Coniochaeta ligniaria NRRL 30616]|uniref:Uncharacterized protein n=1 Tax=Coniochaeta ligniaria NRRL 30616 TaxID=1408157 RepID=A0A1J7J6K5_9PEZI|nr:hypothetical protein CONLIGDRAFT_566384 [Coniochaeta ligniaria NRRL 30616]
MEHDTFKDPADILATRPNGRTSAPLVINRNGSRKDLFGGRQQQPKASNGSQARSVSASLSPGHNPTSPNSRIPRLNSRSSGTLSIKDAYRMEVEAEEKEAAQGSPSPAPRTWRSKLDGGEKTDKSPSQSQGTRRRTGSGRPATRPPNRRGTANTVDSLEADRQGNGDSDSDIDHKIKQFAKEQHHRESDEAHVPGGSNRLAPTPNKSFAWDTDADFTAGDLLVSNSPPVKTGRTSSPPRHRNTKLDEIRALEIEAALKYPDEPPEPTKNDDSSGHRGSSGSIQTHSPPSRPLGRTNTKLDEIRAREIESLSRRAVATARLDEIRERNAESRSRSSSPEIPRKSSKDVFRESPLLDDRSPKPKTRPILENSVEVPDTQVTIFREASHEVHKRDSLEEQQHAGSRATSQDSKKDPISRADSHDLLRRLARAASTSPAPEQQITKSADPVAEPEKEAIFRNPRKERNAEKVVDRPKAVGFAGLRRESSAESVSDKSKRSSLALSDNDPTERIEREMQLFAPMDNHSERGSIRAPSPESDVEDDIEETPRPVRIDPLTQPTPKVTGAYVETPATVKVERPEDIPLPAIVEPGREGTSSDVVAATRGRNLEISLRKPSHTSSAEGDRDATKAKAGSRSFRRAKSLPRARSPLINSVRPPTVRDDLLEIQRTYQIEDSTLDDLDGFFASQDMGPDTASPDQVAEPDPVKIETIETQESLTDQKNSKAINRIGRSLESIRTARKGIERLEDEVSKAKEAGHKVAVPKAEMSDPQPHVHSDHIASTCPICLAQSPSSMVAYVHIPLPRLWRRQPTFRLTFLGFIVSILSLWYLAESTMCALYCKPQYCYPGKPCNWSYDDPFWGYAIPVKLDQWTTGGQGRVLVQKVKPEISDWVADVWDVVTGTDIRTADTRGYDWDQRRQHRRRMMKRGFVKPFVERPEDRDKYEAWRRARVAKEEADARREMGYPVDDEEETMAADERVR